MSREKQRRRIEQALTGLPWPERHRLGLDTGGQNGRSTLAGLLLDTLAPELTRGREAAETLARVCAAVAHLKPDDTVTVRRVLDALHGEEPK